jgi:LuxR family maltose regulon positive regulatory protein
MTFARTKIQPPRPRSAFVERSVLQARLAAALRSQRLVLLCAPGGFGKTALLAHELAHWPADHALAWIAADAGDDLHRLLECLLAALEPFDPPWRSAPEALLAWATRDDDARRRAAAELINTLDACSVAHGVCVFDDVHRVDDAAFFGFLDLLLERLPARWTLALTSRTEPPLAALPRLRAAGEVEELRQLNLQFAREEAHRLIEGAGLPAALADRLFDRTHGWPAGLRIAIGALQGIGASEATAHVDRALRDSDRPLFDFLVNDVLAQLPPTLAAFLLSTSVLHELTPARCAAVTADAQAAAHLDAVERLGLFVDVLDAADGERTLRLHDLFRDALQERLRVERPAAWRVALERAAAIETDPVRQQTLWLAAGAEAQAARALLAAAPLLNLGGAAATVLRLCNAFAPAFAQRSADLQRVLGLALQTQWQLNDAERHYAQAQALYAAQGGTADVQVCIARRAAVLAALGRLSEAADLLATLPHALTDAEAQMVAATAQLWLALERCEFDTVSERFATLLRLQLATTRLEDWQTIPPPRVTACSGVAPLLAQWASHALQVAGDRPAPLRAFALIALGWRALWQGSPAEAAELLARAEAEANWIGEQVIARSHGLALRAAVAVVQGDHAGAMDAMRSRVREQPVGYGGWGLWHALYFGVRVAAACGAADEARAWLTQMLALQPTLPEVTPQRLVPVRGLQGTVAWLSGDADGAMAHWQAALAQETACDLMAQAPELRVRLAAALLQQGDAAAAARWLAPVLRADDGPRGALFAADALRALAAADWNTDRAPDAQALLRTWATRLAPPAAPRDTPQLPSLPGMSLTTREREVLARIAAGDSNKLIARAFDLSLHTVKRHVANVLGKLNVQTRGQAAAWYRTHG